MKQALLLLALTFIISETLFRWTNLYYEVWWLDIPMHIWGGFLLAMLASSYYVYKHRDLSFYKLLLYIFIIAVGWEMFELIRHYLSDDELGTLNNNIKDVFNGLIGAIIYFYYKHVDKV